MNPETARKINEIQEYVESKIQNIEFSIEIGDDENLKEMIQLRFRFKSFYSVEKIPINFTLLGHEINEYLDFVIYSAIQNLAYLYFMKESKENE